MKNSEQNMARLAKLLKNSERIVFFTGAGISTESGIPDFRSKGGIWEKFKPVMFQDFIESADCRNEYWRQRFFRHDDMINAEPNRGHRAVSSLIQRGKASAVITQNTDGLHQKSGVPEKDVIELHGNSTYATCLNCNIRHELEWIREMYLKDGLAPNCPDCGGIIKTATVSFGQPMPQEKMHAAQIETLACDLMIAVGSSLKVFPAATFPITARKNGAQLVILNRDPTDFDKYANLVLNEEIGATLGDVVGVN